MSTETSTQCVAEPFVLFVVCLFVISVISHFGFKGKIVVLIVQVSRDPKNYPRTSIVMTLIFKGSGHALYNHLADFVSYWYWVLGMGYVILLWHSLSLPYNYADVCCSLIF